MIYDNCESQCPKCESNKTETISEMQTDWNGLYWYECYCHECKTKYREVYEMRYIHTEADEEEE